VTSRGLARRRGYNRITTRGIKLPHRRISRGKTQKPEQIAKRILGESLSLFDEGAAPIALKSEMRRFVMSLVATSVQARPFPLSVGVLGVVPEGERVYTDTSISFPGAGDTESVGDVRYGF